MSPTGEKTVQPGDPPRLACVLTIVHQPFDVRIFHKQAKTLVAHGWRVTLIAPGAPDGETVDGVSFLAIPRRARWRRPQNWGLMLRLALRTRADVYHIHDPELLLIAPILRLLTGRPIIYDLHEYYPEAISARPWIPRVLKKPVRLAYHVLERLSFPSLAALIQANEATVDLYSWVRKPNLLVANYAKAESCSQDRDPTGTDPTITCVGGLSEARGATVMIRAIAQVVARVPNAKLQLVGPAESAAYERQLLELVASLGLTDYVIMTGRVPFTRVHEALQTSVAGIVLYLPGAHYHRVSPTKLFEYMAAALPVIAPDTPVCAAIVNEARCGLLVDSRDVNAVAAAMVELLEHPEEAKEMGGRGRQLFLQRYTWEGEVPKLIALYEQLSGGERPS